MRPVNEKISKVMMHSVIFFVSLQPKERNMEHSRLRFALFGNIYQAKKSVSIQKVLSCIANYGAELYVDMEYYYFLKDNQRLEVKATKIFTDDAPS